MRFMIELDRETTQALGESAYRQLRGYRQQALYLIKRCLGTDGIDEPDSLSLCQTDSDHSSFTPEKQRPQYKGKR